MALTKKSDLELWPAALALCVGAALTIAPRPASSTAAPERNLFIADECAGSSNPTFLSNNRRMVVTGKGRQLAVYDPHGSGQQLVWRDPGDEWDTETTGAVSDGLMPGDRNGDRPATIALARNSRGVQHAWVVWAGHDFESHLLSVQMRRINQLHRDDGPLIGAMTTIQSAGNKGHARADIAFEKARRRGRRGVVAWLARGRGSNLHLTVQWFTNLDTDTPRMHHRTVLFSGSHASPTPTLVPVRRGMRLVTTTQSSLLRVYRHNGRAGLRRWVAGRARVDVARASRPSAVTAGSGRVLVAAQRERYGHSVIVARFGKKGNKARVVLRAPGHEQPTLTRASGKTWLVMIRRRDGAVVSRHLGGRGWTKSDHVELAGGGGHAWPNAPQRSGGKLRFMVQGERCPTNMNSNAVIGHQRRV